MSIKGSDTAKLPDYLVSAAAAFRKCKTVWNFEFSHWYPSLDTEYQNALTALLTSAATPEQFVDRLEKAAEAVRQDTSLPRHKVTRG
jgi:ABC-type glycerol-3-phosphate transport system substrate-binding protein